jgi:uncharacterized heparinase superfamily protein
MGDESQRELFPGATDTDTQRLIRFSKRRPVQRCRRILDRCLDLTPGEIVHRVGALLGREPGAGRTDIDSSAALTRESVLEALDRRFILPRRAAAEAVAAVASDAETAARVRNESRLLESEGARIFDRLVALDPATLDWQADPGTGRRLWPQTRLDEAGAVRATRAPDGLAISDVKYAWELNRHQFLPTLAIAHRMDGSSGAAARVGALVERWITQNPVGVGVNWASGLEVGIRILSWLWTMTFVLESPHLSPAHAAMWVASLVEHYDFLRHHLSTYTDRSNHLIGEATALWIVASVLRDLPDSTHERARALDILSVEIERQVTRDGVTCEQAVGYHCFVLDFYLQVVALARRQRLMVPPVIESRAMAMLEFLERLLGAGGALPQIGDGDDGKGLPFPCAPTTRERAETLLALGAELFARPEWSRTGVPRTLARLLLTATEAPAPPPAPVDVMRNRSRLFREGGYCFLEAVTEHGGARQLVFDIGGMGYLPNAAHEHADALSVLVRVNATLLLADPGTGSYTGSRAVRDGFRSTAAHNTVTVDDLDQADALDTFKWINLTRTRLVDWQDGPDFDYVAALHDGYSRLRKAVVHMREILFVRPDYWIIVDRIVGRGSHRVTRRFHFPPDVAVTQPQARTFDAVAHDAGDGLRLVFPDEQAQPAATIRIRRGPWSAGYGVWESSACLTANVVGEAPLTLLTLLVPIDRGQSTLEVTAPATEDGHAYGGNHEVVLCRIIRPDRPGREDRLIKRHRADDRSGRSEEILFIRREEGREVTRPFGAHRTDR